MFTLGTYWLPTLRVLSNRLITHNPFDYRHPYLIEESRTKFHDKCTLPLMYEHVEGIRFERGRIGYTNSYRTVFPADNTSEYCNQHIQEIDIFAPLQATKIHHGREGQLHHWLGTTPLYWKHACHNVAVSWWDAGSTPSCILS